MDELAREMYKEHIMDLYRSPHNFGKLENATSMHSEHNPICGDRITMQVIVKDSKVVEVKFMGGGCAISMASASLITDKVKGMNIDEIKKLNKNDLLELLKIPISPVRLKCALLSLEVLQKTI